MLNMKKDEKYSKGSDIFFTSFCKIIYLLTKCFSLLTKYDVCTIIFLIYKNDTMKKKKSIHPKLNNKIRLY